MVGKQMDSANSTRFIIASPALPRSPTASAWKMMTAVKKPRSTLRGMTNFMIPAPRKRPMAKQPCAMARKLAPMELVVPARTSVT